MDKTQVFSLLNDDILSKVLDEFELFKTVRNDVLKGLEDARNNSIIGSSQEAMIRFTPKVGKEIFLGLSNDELKLVFIASKVEVCEDSVGQEFDNAFVEVKHHDGHKCERCWNYFDELLEVNGAHVCPRCGEVIKDVE